MKMNELYSQTAGNRICILSISLSLSQRITFQDPLKALTKICKILSNITTDALSAKLSQNSRRTLRSCSAKFLKKHRKFPRTWRLRDAKAERCGWIVKLKCSRIFVFGVSDAWNGAETFDTCGNIFIRHCGYRCCRSRDATQIRRGLN